MIDFLTLLGNNGVILNRQKFQFAQKSVNFTGFYITEHSIKPLQKFPLMMSKLALDFIRIYEEEDDLEGELSLVAANKFDTFRAITWDIVKQATLIFTT